jgi:hypothetical protein
MDLSHFYIPATQILQGPYPCQEHPGHRRLVTNCDHLPRPKFARAMSQGLLKPGQQLLHSRYYTARIRNAGGNNLVARRQILLLKTANGNFTIGETKPRQSRLPDRITTATGHTLIRPSHGS